MRILAFETSAKAASVALLEGDMLLGELYLNCFLNGNTPIGIVRQHTRHNLRNHLFQFLQKLTGIISFFFYLTNFLLPDSG